MQNGQAKLQIPISLKLKKELEKKSDELGFSSVNEMARVFLHNLIKGKFFLQFASSDDQKIPMLNEESEKRILQSYKDFANGDYEVIDSSKPNAVKNWLKNV
jgi:hypothetical protein